MKRKLFLVVLVAIVAFMFASCASSASAPESPDKDEAVALYAEVNNLRTEFLKQGKDLTKDPYGRAESIYALGSIYMEKKMYTEALQPLGQAKTYYSGFLK